MSVPKTCTEPESNKMNDNQAGSIIDFDDKSNVGKTNIEADEADKLESNAQLSPTIHVDSMTGLL